MFNRVKIIPLYIYIFSFFRSFISYSVTDESVSYAIDRSRRQMTFPIFLCESMQVQLEIDVVVTGVYHKVVCHFVRSTCDDVLNCMILPSH